MNISYYTNRVCCIGSLCVAIVFAVFYWISPYQQNLQQPVIIDQIQPAIEAHYDCSISNVLEVSYVTKISEKNLYSSIWPEPKISNFFLKNDAKLDFLNDSGVKIVLAPLVQFVWHQDIPLSSSVLRKYCKTFQSVTTNDTAFKIDTVLLELKNYSELYCNTEEHYALFVSSPVSFIFACDLKGLLYGLSSFSQLFSFQPDNMQSFDSYHLTSAQDEAEIDRMSSLFFSFAKQHRQVIFHIAIIDWPSNPYRGLLVDVSRHFIPLYLIKRTIRSMSVSRLNYLHLHLTDSQSFPIQLNDTCLHVYEAGYSNDSWFWYRPDDGLCVDEDLLIPLSHLSAFGAFKGRDTHEEWSYSLKELRELAIYASMWGVSIIPEIDVPAHAFSWGHSPFFHDIVIRCVDTASHQENPLNAYPLNPMLNLTFMVIDGIFHQLLTTFSLSSIVHIGGDEVIQGCWTEDDRVLDWAVSDLMNISTTSAVTHYTKSLADSAIFYHFLRRVLSLPSISSFIESNPKHSIMMWEGSPSDSSNPDITSLRRDFPVIVQPWKCWSNYAASTAVASLKNKIPIVTSACWYLDWRSGFVGFSMEDSTRKVIIDRMSQIDSTQSYLKLMLGGEADLWSEHVDWSNFECRLWPRAAVIANHLWSYPTYRNSSSYVGSNQWWNSRYNMIDRFNTYLSKRLDVNSALFKWESDVTGFSDQCPGIEQSIQREPNDYSSAVIRLSQLNVEEGGGSSNRLDSIIQWLTNQSLSHRFGDQVSVPVLSIVGLCELNGWHEPLKSMPWKRRLFSSKDILPESNLPTPATIYNWTHISTVMEKNSIKSGYPFFHISRSSQPYNIGLMSSMPFEFMEEIGPPTFERGLLHVKFNLATVMKLSGSKALDDDVSVVEVEWLHVFVIHLNAHDAIARTLEAEHVAEAVRLIGSKDRVIVMGDINTLSPLDRQVHQCEKFVEFLSPHSYTMPTQALLADLTRLRKKFLVGEEISYDPYNALVGVFANGMWNENDLVLHDLCYTNCLRIADKEKHAFLNTTEVNDWIRAVIDWDEMKGGFYASLPTWTNHAECIFPNVSTELQSEMNLCMHKNCPLTEPTTLNPEFHGQSVDYPEIRLDFIFGNEIVVRDLLINSAQSSRAYTDVTSVTRAMSDHFPIVTEFKQGGK